MSKRDVPLPVSLPLSEISDLTPIDDTIDKLYFVLARTTAGKRTCTWQTCNTYVSLELMVYYLHLQLSAATSGTR